ncbi:amidohydrolase family protein [Acidimicrobiales bacterium]|nr:amidohydrolase family protein [Acidimicrobiales bacterium]
MDLDRFEWLALRTEAAIDPSQQIVDPHHHLWNRNDSTYLANELLADTGSTHNVTHTVFVECRSKWDRDAEPHMAPVGETRFVAGEAAEMAERDGADIGAIVSHADLLQGDAVAEVLAAHDKAGAGLFRGIRHATPWDEDPDAHNAHTGSFQHMMRSPEFVAGARTLASMGFSFDSWLYHHQIAELVELARAVPDLTIILDHLGGRLGVGTYSEQRDKVKTEWKDAMSAAAACPNIVLKVGGIGMDNVFGTGWSQLERPPSSEEVAAYFIDDIRWVIDTFGPNRCMFESNFPVDRQSLPYAVLWNAMQIMADGYSPLEQADLFAGTAARAYRINMGD